MDKNSRYIIIGCIVIVLLLLAGLAYMQQGTQNNTPTPTPTAEPSATPTATPTITPGSGTGSEVNATATATPTVTPSATPTATPSVTPAPSSTPTPSADPYLAPGWPYYGKQYGPIIQKGTIAAQVEENRETHEGARFAMVTGFSRDEIQVGVLPGSYGNGNGYLRVKRADGVDVPLPTTWTTMGLDRYVSLGEFEYGSYTVYCLIDGYYCQWQSIVIEDSHRDWLVTFEDMEDD